MTIGESINESTTSVPFYLKDRSIDEFYYIHRPMIVNMDRYVTPVWYVIGMSGNLLSFIIWCQRRMRHSSGVYLAALAIADLVFLVLHSVFELESNWSVRVVNVPVLCQMFPIIFLASQYLPALLVLSFTVERYISICHPFKRDKYCRTPIALKVTLCLTLYVLSLHAIQGYFWTYNYKNKDCHIRKNVSAGGVRSLWSIWTWVTELLTFCVVPLTTLVLNMFVIRETRRIERDDERRLHLKRGSKGSSTTVMLLAVSFYLIFTTFPVTLIYAMYAIFPEGNNYMTDKEISTDVAWQRHLTYLSVKIIVQEIGMSHYALNFYIYLLTGKMFRLEVLRLFARCFCRNRQEYIRHTTHTSFSQEEMTKLTRLKQAASPNGKPYGTPL